MTDFKASTVTLIKEITEQRMADVFDAHVAARFHMLAYQTSDNWDGKGAKAPHVNGMFLLAWLFVALKPKTPVDYTRTTIFCDPDGNMELQLGFEDTEITLTFTEDRITVDREKEGVYPDLKPSRAARMLMTLPYFEERDNVDRHAVIDEDFIFCLDEVQWHRWYRNHHADLDPLIIPHLLVLNQYPGIVTTMSCSGHYEGDERKTKHAWFHMTFQPAYAEQNRHLMRTIMNALYDTMDKRSDTRFSMSGYSITESRGLTTDLRRSANGAFIAYWRPNHMLRVRFDDPHAQTETLQTLLEILVENNPARKEPLC